MNKNDYACAVATVRSRETQFLDKAFFEQLITAPSFDDMLRALCDKGLISTPEKALADEFLSRYMEDIWEFLNEIAPCKSELSFLTVENDFQNLKAALKCVVTDSNYQSYMITPSVIDGDLMYEAVSKKNFELLPDYISGVAKNAYKLVTSTMDGQLLDMFVDSSALKALREFASKTESTLINDITEFYVFALDTKIALRITEFKAADELLNSAFSDNSILDAGSFVRAVQKGKDEVTNLISANGYKNLSDAYTASPGTFERTVDDIVTDMFLSANYTSFGIEPLAAYYNAAKNQWKNLRVIINGKYAQLSEQQIRERMRSIYV